MKKLVVGILAHVDAGKTTLSEAMLYTAGVLRKLGRVDHRDAFLDTDAMERERQVTNFPPFPVAVTGNEKNIPLPNRSYIRPARPFRYFRWRRAVSPFRLTPKL